MRTVDDFRDVVLCDFEYHHNGQAEGPPTTPLCACALELRSGREYRLWTEELQREPPWAQGRDVLLVSYSAPAELDCYLSLNWPLPPFILDLLVEHRQLVNGVLPKECPRDLLSAMRFYGLRGVEPSAKDEWRDLILTGGPFDSTQRKNILAYCWSDIEGARKLLEAMLKRMPHDLDRALFRGRYANPATLAMRTGIPVDEALWKRLLEDREEILLETVAECPIYDETIFKLERFAQWLDDRGLLNRWPRTELDRLSTDDATFRKFAHIPEVDRLRKIRQVVDQLRNPSFPVRNGRNYYTLLPFKAETSRNATLRCIFQAPTWLRGLIQPPPGLGLAYIDFEQEEFLIAGVLAQDPAVIRAYAAGDPYVAFGVLAGFIPPGGTKDSHFRERDLAKTLMLAITYGMSAPGLAARAGVSLNRARDLLSALRRVFRILWRWSDAQIWAARWMGTAETAYGWRLAVDRRTKVTTLRNFPVQGSGADILRLASIFLFEAGLHVCAPVHDAFLIQAPESELEEVAQEASRQMVRASQHVLGGYSLRTKVQLLRHPDRLLEKRGKDMWDRIIYIANRLESRDSVGRSVARSVIHPYINK